MIRFKHAMKIARFLTCSGKSATPIPNALGGDMESIDSIHPGGDASGSGALSRLLKPRTMSRAPTVTLMTLPTVETMLSAPPKRISPKTPIAAQVAKYPSARALALGRGLREPRNRIVRRSKGGATEPPMARRMSPGRSSLMDILLAVALGTNAEATPSIARGRMVPKSGLPRVLGLSANSGSRCATLVLTTAKNALLLALSPR